MARGGGGVGKGVLILVGIAAVAVLVLRKKGAPSSGANVVTSDKLKPAKIGRGEEVSAKSYRVIAARRPGMEYVVAQGSPGAQITFASPKGGRFTRNVVREGSKLWAEIKL